jgi:hypothetical protein
MGISISNQLLGSTGLSVGLGLSRGNGLSFGGFGGAPFTPASLFTSGAPGFLLDATLSDLSSLFQDSAGTTPAAIEQPVGLVLNTSAGLPVNPILQKYGSLPGTATNYFSTPDSAANSITGDIDIRALIAPTDWTPSAVTMLVAKWNAGTTNRSYLFYIVATTGQLGIAVSSDGTIVNATSFASTVAPTVSDGNLLWVRATLDVNNGAGGKTAVFYTSSDGLSWTQLGDSITVAGTTSIFNSNAFLGVGATNGGTEWFAGRIYRAQIYNGINGTLAVDFCPPAGWASGTWNSTLTSETWTANGTATVVSVANNFVQSTSAARPVLSARVNLLTKTEVLTDATAWDNVGADATITDNAAVAPNGTTTAASFIPLSGAGQFPYLNYKPALSITSGVSHKETFYIKQFGSSFRYVTLYFNSASFADSGRSAWLDLQTLMTQVQSGVTAVATSEGNGWVRLTITATADATSNSASNSFGFGIVDAMGSFGSVTGNGTDGVYIWGADIRVANDTASPVYQRVNTATDYATTGFPLYLRYDGSLSFLASAATVDFSTTAQMSVFAGLRKLTDSALYQIIADFSTSGGAINNTFTSATNIGTYEGFSKGTVLASAVASGYPAPITNVISEYFDISGDNITVRVNGIQAAISTADQGTGNYGNYPLYIGARFGTTTRSLFLNGRLYFPLVVLGRTATATEITNMESYLSASMGGGYVPTGYDFLVTGDGDQLTDASGNALYTIPLYS